MPPFGSSRLDMPMSFRIALCILAAAAVFIALSFLWAAAKALLGLVLIGGLAYLLLRRGRRRTFSPVSSTKTRARS